MVRNGLHIGFSVERIELDPKTNIRTITFFTRTFESDPPTDKAIGVLKQSANYSPLELKFEGLDHEEKTKLVQKYPTSNHADIFNSALPYVTMSNHPLKGKTYFYHAIKESTKRLLQGEIRLIENKTFNGKNVNRLLADYDGFPQELWVTDTGEVLLIRDVRRDLTSTLVADADQAIKGLKFNRSELTLWFGEIPSGLKNPMPGATVDQALFVSELKLKYPYDPEGIELKLPAPPAK